jgi:hypothetical protein
VLASQHRQVFRTKVWRPGSDEASAVARSFYALTPVPCSSPQNG